MSLSLAMVTRDDAAVVGRALASVEGVCDEMVVVDLGSTDDTVAEAEAQGAVVHRLDPVGDNAAALNTCLHLCTGDWVMFLEPDDVLPPRSAEAVVGLKALLDDRADVVFTPYLDRFDDDRVAHLRLVRERILRRSADLQWRGRAYEQVEVAPERSAMQAEVVVERRADPDRAQRDFERRMAIMADPEAQAEATPVAMFNFGNDLMNHDRHRQAVDAYRRYLAADPDGGHRYWALVSLGECMVRLGDRDGAERALLDAVGDDGSRAEAYVTLGRLRFEAEEWEQAIPLLRAATYGVKPAFGLSREADYAFLPWDFLSICYDKLDRVPEAVEAAFKALPGNPDAERIRANIRWMAGRV